MTVIEKFFGTYEQKIELDDSLLNIGLTSMSSAMFRDALAHEFPSVGLPITLALDYPSVTSIAEYIVAQSSD